MIPGPLKKGHDSVARRARLVPSDTAVVIHLTHELLQNQATGRRDQLDSQILEPPLNWKKMGSKN